MRGFFVFTVFFLLLIIFTTPFFNLVNDSLSSSCYRHTCWPFQLPPAMKFLIASSSYLVTIQF
jgi:hypothetical protein